VANSLLFAPPSKHKDTKLHPMLLIGLNTGTCVGRVWQLTSQRADLGG